MKKVFVSYGHNVFDEVAKTLVERLRKEGDFEVFFDLDCLEKDDWERQITLAIERCDAFLFLVSSKSVSPESYCLNELSYACELKKQVYPLLLDSSFVPLCITRLQRLFFHRCLDSDRNLIEADFLPSYAKLLRLLRGEEKLGYYNLDVAMEDRLETFDPYEIAHHQSSFQGREHIFLDFESWLNNPDALPIYLLEGVPGVGKTSISAALASRYVNNLAGIHFCAFNNAAKTDPKNIIASLACQLSYRNDEYRKLLSDALTRFGFSSLDAKRAFEAFIVEPGRKVSFPSPQVFVIDALDEAVRGGKNEIAEILVSYLPLFPPWLRFFLTSRPQEDVTGYFHSCHRYAIDENGPEHTSDIKKYYDRALSEYEFGANDLRLLMEKTHGSFLYASTIVRSIKAKELSLDHIEDFPDGIYSYFTMWFHRIFDSGEVDYSKARKMLSLTMVCENEPSFPFLSRASKLEEADCFVIAEALSSFFRIEGESWKVRHKSLLDWLSSPKSCPSIYLIREKEGYELMLGYIKAVKSQGRGWKKDPYVIRDYGRCLRSLGLYDELCSLLQDKEYQLSCAKSEFFTLYEGLGEYARNLEALYSIDEDYAYEIYSSPCFAFLFGKYRKSIYNAGLFINLRRCGYAVYLEENEEIGEEVDYEIAVIYFFYISLLFLEAKKRVEALLRVVPLDSIDLDRRCELERTMMLIYRKGVYFDKIEELFPKATQDAKEAYNAFEESLAYLTMSKVKCRELDKRASYLAAEKAIEILEEEVRRKSDERNSQMGDHLFLAEDYRVYADACIWHGDYEKAGELLRKASAIYALYQTTDRYYTRFLYTSLFLETVTRGNKERLDALCSSLDLALKENDDDYDRAQYLFILALGHYLSSKGDPSRLALMEAPLGKAVDLNHLLRVPLEELEAQCLYNLFDELQGVNRRYSSRYNEYSDTWIAYVEKRLREWREAK